MQMNPVLNPARMSLEEYLATEADSPVKREYVNGEVLAMAGAAYRHNKIVANLSGTLFSKLRGGPCEPLGSDQRVLTDQTGLYSYPDLTILCSPPQFVPEVNPETLINPSAVIEVLSPSTEVWDRGAKSAHYRHHPALKEFWLVEFDRPAIAQFHRENGGSWTVQDIEGWESLIETHFAPGIHLPLAEIYRGIAGIDPAVPVEEDEDGAG